MNSWEVLHARVVAVGLIVGARARRVHSPVSASAQAKATGIREVSATGTQPDSAPNAAALHDDDRPAGGEEILDVICGDKDFWVITRDPEHRAREAGEGGRRHEPEPRDGQRRRLLVPAHREERHGMPDLKVYVNADPSAPQGKPKYYSAAQVEEPAGANWRKRRAAA